MKNNIQEIKKHLTIIFTIIVFLVILFLWISSLSIKYFRTIKYEEQNLINFSRIINKKIIPLDSIKIIWEIFQLRDKKKIKELWLKPPIWFINYIYLDEQNNIISSDIKDNIKTSIFEEILESEKYLEIEQKDWFLIRKTPLRQGKKIIFFKKLDYSLIDYLEDILGFTIINIIFSILLYFIWKLFINKAFIPVEENIKEMKNFIHNAGHELKTPISVIDSNLQIIDDTKTYDKEMTKEMKNELKGLISLINSLINLSDINISQKLEKVILKDIIEEIITKHKNEIEKKKLKIKINIPENIEINTNKNYFYIFLSNLIWNAVKYNKQKGSIDISYNSWKLYIKDNWIWINKNDLNKIFDRFFKIDKSRWTQGFGIGLSLVKKIADIYNWKIKVKSKEKEGSEFIINF